MDSIRLFLQLYGLLIYSLGLLTHMDLGDVYLTVISFNNFTPALRKIDFKEFWEV